MSIKNQSRLTVFASLIIGVTVAALFGMNFLIDRISKTAPPAMAAVMPPPGALPRPGLDDSLNGQPQGPNSGAQDDMVAPGAMDQRGGPPMPGPARRVNNGKNDAAMEKRPAAAPQGPRGMGPNGMPMGMPPGGMPPGGMPPGGMMPPGMQNGYYPPSFPENMPPQQREFMEQEMERRRQMMMQGAPEGYGPPGYFPGQMPEYMEEPYDNGRYYNGPPEEYYEYDYESKNDSRSDPNMAQNRTKLADIAEEAHSEDLEGDDEMNGPEDFLEDEYLSEFMEDL